MIMTKKFESINLSQLWLLKYPPDWFKLGKSTGPYTIKADAHPTELQICPACSLSLA